MAPTPFRQRLIEYRQRLLNIRQRLLDFSRQYVALDLRWSYLAIAGMILAGAAANIFLAHGWTIWPFIAAAGLMLMVNEAAERNGQGVPPISVYALFGGSIAVWIILVTVLSALNPLIVVAGIIVLGYYAARAQIRQRERNRQIAFRRENRQCIHCGQPADPVAVYCEHCGEEPNPDIARMNRVAAIAQNPANIARARAMLTPAPPATEIKAKEAALLQKRNRAGKNNPINKSRNAKKG